MKTKTDVAPHSVEAEESILGAALMSRDATETALSLLDATDFYVPRNATIFGVIASLRSDGRPVEALTVADELKRIGRLDEIGGSPTLTSLQVNTASTRNVAHYAEIVRRDANGRRQLFIANEVIDSIQGGADPYDIADRTLVELQSLDRVGTLPEGFTTYDALLDQEDADAPVVVPGLCYADSRVIVVASEKSGKSVLFRMIAFCASQGIHPFTFEQIEPIRVMVWDLENPMRELRKTGSLLRHRLSRMTKYDPDRLMIMRRPAGIDIDSRHDRNELESAIESFRPQMIIGGPVYKMLPEGKMHDDRHAAAIVQNVLDAIRIRYGCALMLEHHAPIGTRDDRELRAIGGMMWQAWPDVSISLKAEDDFRRFVVKRPHPERGSFNWPLSFVRGTKWPWEAEAWPSVDF